jgi:phage shock protein PspC (stress-responsive transcriptional regulator)
MIAGVASGLGRYFNVDPTLVRVIFAGVAVLTGGLGLLAYPVMWFLMPEEPANAPAWPHPAPTAGPVWPPAWPASGAQGPTDASAGPTASMPPASMPPASMPPTGTPHDTPPAPPTSAP